MMPGFQVAWELVAKLTNVYWTIQYLVINRWEKKITAYLLFKMLNLFKIQRTLPWGLAIQNWDFSPVPTATGLHKQLSNFTFSCLKMLSRFCTCCRWKTVVECHEVLWEKVATYHGQKCFITKSFQLWGALSSWLHELSQVAFLLLALKNRR